MRAGASHLAAVADAAGRVLGVAALEDVLEILVGEVHDPAHADPGGPGSGPAPAPSAGAGGALPGARQLPDARSGGAEGVVNPAAAAHPAESRPVPAPTAPRRTPA